MGTFWGAETEINDLGVVAEQCPHCGFTMPCLLRSISRGNYVLFVKTTDFAKEWSCLCTGCRRTFTVNQWRYAAVVPILEAKALSTDELLARTNPGLKERIELKEQVSSLGGDHRFAVAYERLEEMRPGAMRSRLLQQLLAWDRLPEEERNTLAQQIEDRIRAWQFGRQIALSFPASAGCLTLAVAAVIVGPVAAWMFMGRKWLWGSLTLGASLVVASVIDHLLFARKVRQWTRKVLIPEAQDANVSANGFLEVVDDVPGSRLGLFEELWPVKNQLEIIRGVMIADGMLQIPEEPVDSEPGDEAGTDAAGL